MNTFKQINLETMTPCLIQQLFRLKIGLEPDKGLIDAVLFPMLRSRKDLPKELLLDIKLILNICSSRVARSLAHRERWTASALFLSIHSGARAPVLPTLTENISPFELKLRQGSAAAILRDDIPTGKVNSTLRRRRHMSAWGTIDILNELRSLKHPHIDYFPPCNPHWVGRGRHEHHEEVFIRLEETGWRPNDQSSDDSDYVNKFLEDALATGKRLSWGGDPAINSHEKILSTYY